MRALSISNLSALFLFNGCVFMKMHRQNDNGNLQSGLDVYSVDVMFIKHFFLLIKLPPLNLSCS